MSELFFDTSVAVGVHQELIGAIRQALEGADTDTVVTIHQEQLPLMICGIRLGLEINPRKVHLASAWISARVNDGLSDLPQTFVSVLQGMALSPLDQFSIRRPDQMLVTWGSFPEKAAKLILSAASSFTASSFDDDGYLKEAPRASH